MNVNPLVSIIIPSYNRAHLIGETLDSVLAQTYQNWECIVVDDGSTDATASVVAAYLKKDARFQYHQRPENRSKGGNAARNYGLEISRGNFLFFLDSDDLLTLDCITNRVFVTIENENYNFYVFQSLLFDKVKDDLKIIPNVLSKEGVSDLERFISYDYPWNISAAFY